MLSPYSCTVCHTHCAPIIKKGNWYGKFRNSTIHRYNYLLIQYVKNNQVVTLIYKECCTRLYNYIRICFLY